MNSIKIEKGKHKCYGERKGNWVIFRCPLCPDYERRMNFKTGEISSKYDKNNYNLHNGFYIKPGLDIDGGFYRHN